MIRDAIKVRLKPKERAVLEARLRAGTTEQRQLLRIRIVLDAADGLGTREIARELETTPTTVSLWRGRFARERLDGLEDLPRSGAILQGQSLNGASFTSVERLKEHIDAFIERYNEIAEPFVWTKSKVHRRRVKGRRLSEL